jgi:signal peptidase I
MIQVFRFDKSLVESSEYTLLTGSEKNRFFLKRILYLILMIYSTLFLAVAIPFVKTPFIPIYFIGSLASTLYAIRLVNYFIKAGRFSSGKIRISEEEIEVTGNEDVIKIKTEDIDYVELNILGDIVIKEKGKNTVFPAGILSGEDRTKLLNSFSDMSPKRTAMYNKIWELLDAVAVALILAVHIIQFIIQAYFIPTGSMKDTLMVGDHLFVEKITYGPIIPQMIGMDKPIHLSFLGIREIKRGDIVIFRPPHETDKDYIKRCIALPGDKFEIKNGKVYINGEKTDESSYVKGETIDPNSKVQGIVPPGNLVVLGDNRENSMDSRYFGYLEIERIKGRALFLYWNSDQIRKFDFSRIGFIR